MSNTQEYNGWANYATWRVKLEMFDDYELVDLVPDGDIEGKWELATVIEEYADDVISDYGELKGLALDYARAFLNDVVWVEIADSILYEANN